MTRSRTKLAVAGLSLLAVVFSAACGGDDDGSDKTNGAPLQPDIAAPPGPPVTEVAARAALDPCGLLEDATEPLGLPDEPTDTQQRDAEGKLCTWKQDKRTVILGVYSGNVDQAAQGLGTAAAPVGVDVAGNQGRQYPEASSCVMLFALSGNRSLVVVGSDEGADSCALVNQAAQAAVPRVA
jgi:hypothetical protein